MRPAITTLANRTLQECLNHAHLASFLRQISINCLISETSRGMVAESGRVMGRRGLSLARLCGWRLDLDVEFWWVA